MLFYPYSRSFPPSVTNLNKNGYIAYLNIDVHLAILFYKHPNQKWRAYCRLHWPMRLCEYPRLCDLGSCSLQDALHFWLGHISKPYYFLNKTIYFIFISYFAKFLILLILWSLHYVIKYFEFYCLFPRSFLLLSIKKECLRIKVNIYHRGENITRHWSSYKVVGLQFEYALFQTFWFIVI